MEAITNKPIGLFPHFDAALTLPSSWSPGKIKSGCLEPSRKINQGHRTCACILKSKSIPEKCLFSISTSLRVLYCSCHSIPCVFYVKSMNLIYSLLFFFLLVTYPGKCPISGFAFKLPTCGQMVVLLYFSQTIVQLSQTRPTFLSTPYSVNFASLSSDQIRFVHTSLVHLHLFKEPIFHETFPDTPGYNWFLSPLRFLVPYQIAWHDIYLWWLNVTYN